MGPKRNANLCVPLILFSLILSLILPAGCNTYNASQIIVDPTQSIQSAINGAPENSTILLRSGIYTERIRIIKPLTLVGSGNQTVIQNPGSGRTIEIPRGINGVTLANFSVNGSKDQFSTGIFLNSLNNIIHNIIVANHTLGIYLYDSSGNILRNNRLINNTFNLKVFGLYLSHFLHDIDTSNLVNGRKVYYWINEHDEIVPTDAGYIAAINCTNIVMRNLRITDNFSGVLLAYTNNSVVWNVTCQRNEQGIRLICSHNNTIVNSTLQLNEWSGISLEPSSNNVIVGNLLNSNTYAISLSHAPYLLNELSEGNIIFGNFISYNDEGIYLDDGAHHNEISNNELVNNKIGITIDRSGNNTFYHNIFINNTKDVNFIMYPLSQPPANIWDAGYPSGGNYWMNYSGTDTCKGIFQNEIGSDGIGDKPLFIDSNNQDMYPLIAPINTFFAGAWNGMSYYVEVISNSTLSDFHFNPDEGSFLWFNVKGEAGTSGFCRVIIPDDLLWVEYGQWEVRIDNATLIPTILSDENYTYIYFTYNHTTKKILIEGTNVIPEFSSAIVPLIFMIFIIIAVAFAKKRRASNQKLGG